jgi:predicted alpha/beta-hydrolase family hydrolase
MPPRSVPRTSAPLRVPAALPRTRAVLLTPGAGSSASNPSLVAIERRLPELRVLRMDFPYRLAGRRAPDRAPVLLDAVRIGAAALAEETPCRPDEIVLGGRSMGGRMCSMAIADGLSARALVCICYPLHPPGKPENLRIAHLPDLNLPCLFISGTRDPFGTPDELRSHTEVIPGPVEHHWIEGAGHDLKGKDAAIAELVADWVGRLGPMGAAEDAAQAKEVTRPRRPRVRPPG